MGDHSVASVNRRGFIAAAVGSGALLTSQSVHATPPELEIQPPLSMMVGQTIPTVDELLAAARKDTGTIPPYEAEVTKARGLLNLAPTNTRPVDVALFFLGIGFGDQGQDAIPYVEEWPIRWNPLIVSFFDLATTYRDWVGDTTHWCAAFVNYCILRSRGKRDDAEKLTPATKSAASATFRRWASETKEPLMGDIVVFRKQSDPNFGHVGFVLSVDRDHVFVIGGNQRSKERTTTGQVCVTPYPKSGKDLVLHSFRTDASLHDR